MKNKWSRLAELFEKNKKPHPKSHETEGETTDFERKAMIDLQNAAPVFAVRLLLEEDGHVLFLRQTRQNGGRFSLPGGNVDGFETAREALCREAKEEAGIKLTPDRLEFCHVLHRRKEKTGEVLVNFYFRAQQFKGSPESREPDKFKDVAWLPLAALPDDLSKHTRKVLDNIALGKLYTEWPKVKKKHKEEE